MTTLLHTCTKRRTAYCYNFTTASVVKIRRRMKANYGESSLSQKQVYDWSRNLINRLTSVKDPPIPCRGTLRGA